MSGRDDDDIFPPMRILSFALTRFQDFAERARDRRRSAENRRMWLSRACGSLMVAHRRGITAPDDTEGGGR